jgi:hypothetical protein
MNLDLLMDLILTSHFASLEACDLCGGEIETGFSPTSRFKHWDCVDCGHLWEIDLDWYLEVIS